jgi:selenide,water dikinase
MINTLPAQQDLLLIGGGHSHALVAGMWAMKPVPGVRLTLVSPQVQTPYSGMLPGLVAGHYCFDETHIDLVKVCECAGIRYIQDEVSAIDLSRKTVQFENRPDIAFDIASINTGITPLLSVPGAAQHCVSVKPIANFYPRWQEVRDAAQAGQSIAVVGGGAAGVELVLSMAFALEKRDIKLHLVQANSGQPEGYPAKTQQQIRAQLDAAGITVHENARVTEAKTGELCFTNGSLKTDYVFWCTQAGAASWPANSGLACDDKGFILVNDTLQSSSHDFIFAAGDIAVQLNNPRPRAGVFAVRQAPTLNKNLRAALLGEKLRQHKPQKHFLSMLACGDKFATASRESVWFPSLQGHWVWRWKDHIDRGFMRRFHELSPREMTPPTQIDPRLMANIGSTVSDMRCDGCAAKLPDNVIKEALRELPGHGQADVLLGMNDSDDCSVIDVSTKKQLVQSVDMFRALVSDPYLQGRIAVEHALSDLFAMNAKAHSALALVSLPYAADKINARDLRQLMLGAVSQLNQHACTLLGGHSSEASEAGIGFSVNGFAENNSLLLKGQALPDQVLILTQALGSGCLFAAHKQLQAEGRWIADAIENMLLSNASAGEIFARHNASACTDVTGFGLLGHLKELLGEHCGASVRLGDLPALDGSLSLLQQGLVSSLHAANAKQLQQLNGEFDAFDPRVALLLDPQTSGGLLAAVPTDRADTVINELLAAGYAQACRIGETNNLGSIALT